MKQISSLIKSDYQQTIQHICSFTNSLCNKNKPVNSRKSFSHKHKRFNFIQQGKLNSQSLQKVNMNNKILNPSSHRTISKHTFLPILIIVLVLNSLQTMAQDCSCDQMKILVYDINMISTYYHCPSSCSGPPELYCHIQDICTIFTVDGPQLIQDCYPCDYNCLICANSVSCIICIPGYIEVNGICQICAAVSRYGAGCTTCDISQCLTCLSPYVKDLSLFNTPCVSCSTIASCLTCVDGVHCTSCDAGYAVLTTDPLHLCTPCGAALLQCILCENGIKCTACNVGYCTDPNAPNWDCVAASSVMPNCNTCNNGLICTSCQSGYALDLLLIPKTCVPCSVIPNCSLCSDGPICTTCVDGYGMDLITGSSSCILCNKLYKCLLCANGPKCTKCEPGFFLNTTTSMCLPCQFPCAECSETQTNCTKCSSSELSYLDGPTSGNCKFCSNILTNCRRCNLAGTKCFECNSTKFYVDSTDTCVDCTAPCLQCTSSTECISCVSNTTILANGSLPGAYQCKKCSDFMPNCNTCLQPNVCTGCDTSGGPFYITYPPTACWTCDQAQLNCLSCASSSIAGQRPICTICKDKFYLFNDSCYSCPLSCVLCTNSNTCSSCVANGVYALRNNMCVFCSQVMPNCLECSSNTSCTKCARGSIINSGCCIECTSLQFHNEINQTCDPCIAPCISCLTANDCLTCVEFYEYVPANNQCKDLCGDSIVITDECDLGVGVFHDGCTDQCKQQPNYTCRNDTATVSGQSVSKSTCSYDLKVDISLFSVEKEPFKNTMTFTYVIAPYLFGLPGTTLRSFTQDELKQTFVLFENTTTRLLTPSSTPGINVESVTVDPSNSKVSVTFSYDRNIRESGMELYLDFQYLKSTLALPHFTTTPDSDHVFQISSFQPQSKLGQFYTEEQYSQASILNKVATVIGIMSFLAFLIGIFTKEVVGLEMAMLCQFTYISLFFFQDTLELPFFALKGLVYSTGYNLPLADLNYKELDQNPPQSFTLGFDPRTMSSNFNLMAVFYLLPLVMVIPFIPLKAKCVRKISMIELGNKWVDLLLGEIMLFSTLFNFQYLLFGVIAFYRDGRDITNYASSMIIALVVLCTICSFLGLLFKPEIYGNFRTAFRYDSELRSEIVAEREKSKECEEHLTKKFKEESKCEALKTVVLKFRLFINESYFWKNHRRVHTLLTYNHYNFVLLYFSVMVLVLNLIQDSEIVLMGLSMILLLDLILMRPYCEVSQKLRAIYFATIYIGVSLVRYANKNGMFQSQNFLLSQLVLLMLGFALIWTYMSLGMYFYVIFIQKYISEEQVIVKVFQQTDQYDFKMAEKQEDMVMRKLMKRYQRVELQYNLENIRTQLMQNHNQMRNKISDTLLTKDKTIYDPFDEIIVQNNLHPKGKSVVEEIFDKAEEDKFYKNLRDDLKKQHRKKKKGALKGTVTGQEMLKFLKLNNFSKYEKGFIADQNLETNSSHYKSKDSEQKSQTRDSEQGNSTIESENVKSLKRIKQDENEEMGQERQEKEDYKSVQPKNLEEAEQKIQQERILIDQNQFVRYKRAMKLLSKDGLSLDKKLIASRYDFV